MGKFDERTLRMRKERIDLFGDNSVSAIISRPEKRPLTYREAVPSLASQVANANPAVLCFDLKCKNEVHALNVFMFVSTHPDAPPMGMAACESCSKKSNEEVLDIVRAQFASEFFVDPIKPGEVAGAYLPAVDIHTRTVRGITLGCTGNEPSDPFLLFVLLMEQGKLRRFEFTYRGHNNCYAVTRELHLDLKDLGIEDRFEFKEGFCSALKNDGHPIGIHRWIELDGWVIDGSGGAMGNPILFQPVEDYYHQRQMVDVKEVPREAAP